MKALCLALTLAVSVTPLHAFDPFDLFRSKPKKQPVAQHHTKKKPKRASTASPTPTPTPTPAATPQAKNGSKHRKIVRKDGVYFAVDLQWLANYKVYELAWDYKIPEDDEIKFVDGEYHVPAVVYRHYEDMEKTRKPDAQDR